MNEFFLKFRYLLLLIPIVAAPLALYWNVSGFGFVWDDKPLYINDKNYPFDNVFSKLPGDFIPTENEMYIPVTKSAWAIVASFSIQKDNNDNYYYSPEIFHILNLAFHILNGILVFFIIRKLLDNDWAGLFGALIFVLHPLGIEPVAWISEFRGLFSTFWGLLAIILFLSYRDEPGKIKYSFTFIFLVFSVLSKPSGIVFPFIIILMDIIVNKPKLKDILITSLPLILVTLPVVYTTIYSESQASVIFNYPEWMRGLFFLDSFQFYLSKAIIPYNLAASYGRTPEFVQQSTFFYYSGASLLVIIGLLIWKRKSSANYLVALIIFIFGFLPVSGILPFYYQYWSLVADRYAYISLMGFAIALSALGLSIEKPKLIIPIGILILGGYFFLGMEQLPAWESDFTLWNDVIEKYPERSAHPHTGRGLYYLDKEEATKALNDFNKVIELDSSYPEAYLNRGNAYFDMQQYDSAANDYSVAITRDSVNPSKAYINRGKAYSALNRLDIALKDYTIALKYNPPDIYSVYSDRGIVFAQLGLLDEAIADFKNALKINPRSKIAYENLQYAQMLKQKLVQKQKDTTNILNQ
jgi:protein O-mannosyl-transferase